MLMFVSFDIVGAVSSDSCFGEHVNDARPSSSTTADRQPPHSSYSFNSNDATQFNDNQVDLLDSLDYDNGSIINGRDSVPETTADSQMSSTQGSSAVASSSARRNEAIEFGSASGSGSGDNYVDDYNDDSVSDISDISEVFKLNSDMLPEMQRSIDWVSRCEHGACHQTIAAHFRRIYPSNSHTIKHSHNSMFAGAFANCVRRQSTRLSIEIVCK